MAADEPSSDRRFSDRRQQDRRSAPGRRTSDEPQDSDLPTIRQLGRYRLLRKLGSGAMAHVFLAEDPTMRRQVAIKTLALAEEFAEQDLDAAREQFIREAQAGARLNHPNIVAIHDFGEDGGLSYIVMEFCAGKPTTAYRSPDRLLPPQWVLELVAQAADALHYAHGQSVIHRDIKPANLMYDANRDNVKITDFGVARLTDVVRTRSGVLLGTPTYMAPEQFTGNTVNGRTDIFSLGVTAYHLLTGWVPFRAPSLPKLVDVIVQQPHEPASRLRPTLPRRVDEVLDMALAKDPANRYPSARAMASAIRACIRGLSA